MKIRAAHKTTRMLAGVLAAATVATTPIPAMAQDDVSEARIRKIEAEIRALQRNVFQSNDSQFFEPEIAPGENNRASTTTNPASTTAVTDILARLDAIEQQLQRLTAQTEENGNKLSGMEARVAALESARETAMASNTGAEAEGSAAETNLAAMTGGAASREVQGPVDTESNTAAPTTPAATGPSASRVAAVQAITKPQTDDAGDDDYSYGFRLWNAGFYPEARQALSDFIEKYPGHSRQTYARNLLGRAYLDDGKADEAASWFIKNYQTDKQARRAPDSLLYLSEAMIALKDTRRACIALGEFASTYPAVAGGRLSAQYQANLGKVDCASEASN